MDMDSRINGLRKQMKANHTRASQGSEPEQVGEPIPRSALVAWSRGDLCRDLRSVAMVAASDWSRANAAISGSHDDPSGFGAKMAQAYLGALRELNAGFEPEGDSHG